jgi:hypothetical protein
MRKRTEETSKKHHAFTIYGPVKNHPKFFAGSRYVEKTYGCYGYLVNYVHCKKSTTTQANRALMKWKGGEKGGIDKEKLLSRAARCLAIISERTY